MTPTGIEWTEETWNPVTGCDKVSPGCAHCYAETFAERWRGTPGHPYEHGFDLTLRPERLDQPERWTRPRMIFVNSMSDLFHENISDDFVEQVWGVMERAHWHTFQVLTKRSERMRDMTFDLPVLPNVWVGVSVENQRWTERLEDLCASAAAVRFVSCEPLLGPLDLTGQGEWAGNGYLDVIDWVIVGGESGAQARPMRPEWARGIRDQCLAAGVPFFFKQWGQHDASGARVPNKGQAGRLLDGREWNEMPEAAS